MRQWQRQRHRERKNKERQTGRQTELTEFGLWNLKASSQISPPSRPHHLIHPKQFHPLFKYMSLWNNHHITVRIFFLSKVASLPRDKIPQISPNWYKAFLSTKPPATFPELDVLEWSITLPPVLHFLHMVFQIIQSRVDCEAEPQPVRTSQAPPCVGDKSRGYLGHSCVLLASLVWVTARSFYKEKVCCQVPFTLFMCFFLEHQEYSFPARMWGWDAELEYDYTGIFKAGTSVLNKGLREFLYTQWVAVKKN